MLELYHADLTYVQTYLDTGHEQLGNVGHSAGREDGVVGERDLASRGALDPVVRHERVDPCSPQTEGDRGEVSVEGRNAL